jgi:hypothetical protein
MCWNIKAFYTCHHAVRYVIACDDGDVRLTTALDGRRSGADVECFGRGVGVGEIEFPWLCETCARTARPGDGTFAEVMRSLRGYRLVPVVVPGGVAAERDRRLIHGQEQDNVMPSR